MTTTKGKSPSSEETTIDRLERLLDEWRGRIDELLVQVNLASKDVSEEARSRAAAAENAYLAARSRLREMPRDAGANLGSLRSGVERLIDDLRRAYDSAQAAIRRGRTD